MEQYHQIHFKVEPYFKLPGKELVITDQMHLLGVGLEYLFTRLKPQINRTLHPMKVRPDQKD